MVTVLTQPDCMPCKITLRTFDKQGVPYQTRPVAELTNDELATYKARGHSQSPIVVLPNGDSWSGFRPDKIKALQLP